MCISLPQLKEEWQDIRYELLHPKLIVLGLGWVAWIANYPAADSERFALLGLALWLHLLIFIDLRTFTLPDVLTKSGLVSGMFLSPIMLGMPVWNVALGALLGTGIFWLLGEVFYRLKGEEGLGLGDAKLLGMLGAWVGVTGLPLILLISSFGLLGWILLRKLFRSKRRQFAYGPWLALAGWLVMLYQPWLWQYLAQFRSAVLGWFA